MRINPLVCGRENDLVGFLYGELNEIEATDFERHLRECAACKSEIGGFGPVRESIIGWRNESLGSIGSPTKVTDPTPIAAVHGKPSAVAALREFFNLSPLWLKGAVGLAAILFGMFAGLALARLRGTPTPAVVMVPAATHSSPQELEALVSQRVKEELERIKNSEPRSAAPLTANNSSQKNALKQVEMRNNVALSASSQKARRPLSKSEREQLAADLRLVSAKNDSELDLLDDRINQ
jgi:hypothetical protein